MKSRAWKAFLPIPSTTKSNEPPTDALWLAAHGIEREALQVLRVVRTELYPVISNHRHVLAGFHFLVHSREEGVPCASKDDHRAFIDLSLYFRKSVNARPLLSSSWLWVTPRQGDTSITKDIELLNKQSDLYLQLVHRWGNLPELQMLMQIRQSLHYFANMSQCRIA